MTFSVECDILILLSRLGRELRTVCAISYITRRSFLSKARFFDRSGKNDIGVPVSCRSQRHTDSRSNAEIGYVQLHSNPENENRNGIFSLKRFSGNFCCFFIDLRFLRRCTSVHAFMSWLLYNRGSLLAAIFVPPVIIRAVQQTCETVNKSSKSIPLAASETVFTPLSERNVTI